MYDARSFIEMENHKQKQSEKEWWAPVWKGLVVDSQAKHYRKMKNAVWLYLYLIVNANRATGVLLRKINTIRLDMGVSRDTVIRWLNLLRQEGYIVTVNTGHSLTIQVTNWKPLPKYGNIQQQKSDISNTRSWINPTPALPAISPNYVHSGQTMGNVWPANKMNINILFNNNTKIMQNAIAHNSNRNNLQNIAFIAGQETLALELAYGLHDPGGIGRYRSYCQKYPEVVLRTVLNEVNKVPAIRIKKSRAALFNYLLQQHAQRTTENPGG